MKNTPVPSSPDIEGRTGKCPLCGMNLIPLGGTTDLKKTNTAIIIRIMGITPESDSSAAGFDKHTGHHTRIFLKRFWITLVLSVPVLLLPP